MATSTDLCRIFRRERPQAYLSEVNPGKHMYLELVGGHIMLYDQHSHAGPIRFYGDATSHENALHDFLVELCSPDTSLRCSLADKRSRDALTFTLKITDSLPFDYKHVLCQMENVIEFEVGNAGAPVNVTYYENGAEVTLCDSFDSCNPYINPNEVKFWIMDGEYEGAWPPFAIPSRHAVTGCSLL